MMKEKEMNACTNTLEDKLSDCEMGANLPYSFEPDPEKWVASFMQGQYYWINICKEQHLFSHRPR